MRYVVARYNEKQRDMAYRIYLTDSLKYIAENTARCVEGGQYLTARYIDVINPKPIDNRTGDEIAIDVMKRAGLSFAKGGEQQ